LNAASGALTWNTFLNGVSSDASTTSFALATDSLYVYMAGYSTSAWGSPMRAFTGNPDAFAARISLISGNLIWNTFLGASADEFVLGLAVDGSGNTYVTGYSNTPSFADPIIDYWWKNDAFVARLDATGARVWSTFLGGNLDDFGYQHLAHRRGPLRHRQQRLILGFAAAAVHRRRQRRLRRQARRRHRRWWNTFLGGTEAISATA
jgi:hypothetical protein